jgi:hypothetical protein
MSDLDNEKLQELYLEKINNANALEFMTRSEGWTILINSLEEKKNNQIAELVELPPGDDEAVLRAHAIAFAVAHTVDDVSGSVYRAIQEGEAAKRSLSELVGSQYNEQDEDNLSWN